jgi:hypothetical protein
MWCRQDLFAHNLSLGSKNKTLELFRRKIIVHVREGEFVRQENITLSSPKGYKKYLQGMKRDKQELVENVNLHFYSFGFVIHF